MSRTRDLFPGFAEDIVDTGSAQLFVRYGGAGRPLLLLHSYPQSHVAWHRIAPQLANRYSVVVPDLRGFGRSSCPPVDPSDSTYSRRVMVRDMLAIMDYLGHSSFSAVGHGRGGCIAHRLAIDAASRIDKFVAIEMVPACTTWDQLYRFARPLSLNWALLAQPVPMPELLIARDPAEWVAGHLARLSAEYSLTAFDERAVEDYHGQLLDPLRRLATCEQYRACASQDNVIELADLKAGKRIGCPFLVVWGSSGALKHLGSPLDYWRPWCGNMLGISIETGHWIAEEASEELLECLVHFFSAELLSFEETCQCVNG